MHTLVKYKTFFYLILLLAGAGWVWVSRVSPGENTSGKIPAPQKGFQAPDFSLPDAAGQTIRLSDLRGKPVLVNVWASWCTPCRAEMPAMQRAFQEYQAQGLVILGINATNQDDRQAALNYARSQGLSFPILLDDDGLVSKLYAVHALPSSFFIDPQGTIQDVVIGGPMSEALLRIRIEQLIEKAIPEAD
jgi:cytochrome c biogenesis protein CcmG, thiol:disulfide interchange protein DsbE